MWLVVVVGVHERPDKTDRITEVKVKMSLCKHIGGRGGGGGGGRGVITYILTGVLISP